MRSVVGPLAHYHYRSLGVVGQIHDGGVGGLAGRTGGHRQAAVGVRRGDGSGGAHGRRHRRAIDHVLHCAESAGGAIELNGAYDRLRRAAAVFAGQAEDVAAAGQGAGERGGGVLLIAVAAAVHAAGIRARVVHLRNGEFGEFAAVQVAACQRKDHRRAAAHCEQQIAAIVRAHRVGAAEGANG